MNELDTLAADHNTFKNITMNTNHTPSLSCMDHGGTNTGQTKSTLCSDLKPPPIFEDWKVSC